MYAYPSGDPTACGIGRYQLGASVTDTAPDCPDIRVATVGPQGPFDAAPSSIDCLRSDCSIDLTAVTQFCEQLRREQPPLPVVIATETHRTVPAALSVHATVAKADHTPLPAGIRVVTPAATSTDSPAVSAD